MGRKYSISSKFKERKTKNRMSKQSSLKKSLLLHQSLPQPHPNRQHNKSLQKSKKRKGTRLAWKVKLPSSHQKRRKMKVINHRNQPNPTNRIVSHRTSSNIIASTSLASSPQPHFLTILITVQISILQQNQKVYCLPVI